MPSPKVLKWYSLIILSLQNASLSIILHYSRISTPPDRTYSAAAAVFLTEVLKAALTLILALHEQNRAISDETRGVSAEQAPSSVVSKAFGMLEISRWTRLAQELVTKDCWKMAIPAILYVVQNNLQYLAASNLDVATFQVTYQMKILTTAVFSVVLLGKKLDQRKWIALFLLAIGVAIVQLQTVVTPAADRSLHDVSARIMDPVKGLIAVIIACVTSGLAGVYFELVIKSPTESPNLWTRNLQLCLFATTLASIPVLVHTTATDDEGWSEKVWRQFQYMNGWAVATILTQTFGGLLTAMVIRYADNILKGFATSIAIILSFLASVLLFSYPVTIPFVGGAAVVLCATYLYNRSPLVGTIIGMQKPP